MSDERVRNRLEDFANGAMGCHGVCPGHLPEGRQHFVFFAPFVVGVVDSRRCSKT